MCRDAALLCLRDFVHTQSDRYSTSCLSSSPSNCPSSWVWHHQLSSVTLQSLPVSFPRSFTEDYIRPISKSDLQKSITKLKKSKGAGGADALLHAALDWWWLIWLWFLIYVPLFAVNFIWVCKWKLLQQVQTRTHKDVGQAKPEKNTINCQLCHWFVCDNLPTTSIQMQHTDLLWRWSLGMDWHVTERQKSGFFCNLNLSKNEFTF